MFRWAVMLIFFNCWAAARAVAISCSVGTTLSRKPASTAESGSNISPLITERWKVDLLRRSRASSIPTWCIVMPICTSFSPMLNGPSTPMR
ncbi:hypothetical protein D3C81_1769360 [compost metagenome]